MCQDLRKFHDGPVKKSFVDLPIKSEKFKTVSGNLLSPYGAQNKDIRAILQTSLTGLR